MINNLPGSLNLIKTIWYADIPLLFVSTFSQWPRERVFFVLMMRIMNIAQFDTVSWVNSRLPTAEPINFELDSLFA